MDSEKTILSRLNQIEKMLTSQKTVLSFSETAEYTGLSKSYLYKLTSGGVIPHYKPTGKMLYFKKTEDFVKVIDGIQDKYAKKTKVLKAVSICLLYGYIDYALELFYMISDVFDKHERKIIEKMINKIDLFTRRKLYNCISLQFNC